MKKQVRFCPEPKMDSVERLECPSERASVWWTAKDYRRFRAQCAATIKYMRQQQQQQHQQQQQLGGITSCGNNEKNCNGLGTTAAAAAMPKTNSAKICCRGLEHWPVERYQERLRAIKTSVQLVLSHQESSLQKDVDVDGANSIGVEGLSSQDRALIIASKYESLTMPSKMEAHLKALKDQETQLLMKLQDEQARYMNLTFQRTCTPPQPPAPKTTALVIVGGKRSLSTVNNFHGENDAFLNKRRHNMLVL